MNTADILHALTHADRLPREALEAASAQRDEMLPLFLREIDAYLARGPDEVDAPTPLFFIFYLFGEWRATSAYRPLLKLLRAPDDQLDMVFGDYLADSAHRVMAAVFDGDPQPLFDLILDGEAEEFVRSRMLDTLVVLCLHGMLDRAVAHRFLRDAFAEIRPQAANFVWQGWQSAIALLGLTDLKRLVRKAFDRRFIDPSWLAFGDFERDLSYAVKFPEMPCRRADDYTVFGDAVDEMSTWYCFSDKCFEEQERWERHAKERERLEARLDFLTDVGPSLDPADIDAYGPSYVNPMRHVGRNDPCPCGSGKKSKKCCLSASG